MSGTISFHLNHFGMKRVYLMVKCYPTTRLKPKQKNSNGHRFLFRYLSRIRYFWQFGKRQYRKLPSWAGFAAYSFCYFEGRTELHFLLKVRLRPYWCLHPDLTAGPSGQLLCKTPCDMLLAQAELRYQRAPFLWSYSAVSLWYIR